MALHISIDVDQTILDDEGQLLPGVRDTLARLKANDDYQLQLWSKGGAAYAQEMAEKWNLTHYFHSFASKPDVAIDDLPEDAAPICRLGVPFNSAARAIDEFVAESVDTALQPSRELVELVAEIQSEQDEIEREYANLLREDIPLHPVPFFGNLDGAKVVTIALNPSTTEFNLWRHWPEKSFETNELARRLSSYFRSVNPPPHPWFSDYQEALGIIGADYKINAAHLDLSPWPFLSPTWLKKQSNSNDLFKKYNAALLDGRSRWLEKLISICSNKLKVVLIFDPFEDRANVTTTCCRQALPEDWGGLIANFNDADGAKNWCWNRKDSLCQLVGIKSF